MFRKIRTGIVGLALVAAIFACSDDSAREVDDAGAVAEKVETQPSTELVALSFAEWELKRKTYVPDIVVVDLWATWCVPCLERFPHMVEMHNTFKDRGVQFVSLSLDDREDQSSIEFARTFLKEQNATFPNFLLDENILEGFELIDIRTVPAVNIYDRSGKLVRELNYNNPNKQFSDEDIERAVTELLELDGSSGH